MKHLLILLFTLPTLALATNEDLTRGDFGNITEATIFCDSKYEDGIMQVDATKKINSCTADVVWGFDNTCYVGDPAELIAKINDGQSYKWKVGLEMNSASLQENGNTIRFTGIDQWPLRESSIDPCTQAFFNEKTLLN